MNFLTWRAANLCDGKLSVYLLHRTGRLGLIKLVLWTILGFLKQAEDFEMLSTSELVIETRRKRSNLLVAVDGEFRGWKCRSFSGVPKSFTRNCPVGGKKAPKQVYL
jgi:diacylglycerol kinase family enzyme